MSDVIKLAHSNPDRSERIEEFGDKLAELLEEYEDIGEINMCQILDITALSIKLGYIEFDEE